jgi:hypothetical protein
VFPIGGGSPAEDDDDDDDDVDLGDDADDDDTDDGDDDDDEPLTASEKKLEKRLKKTLDSAAQSIADRVINASRTAERKAARAKEQGRTGASTRSSASAVRAAEEAERRVESDIREGRVAFKDAFSDHGLRLSPDERQAAVKMGRAMVAEQVRSGADPDDAAIEAARIVATTLKGLRKSAKAGVLQQLKNQGVDVSKLGADDTSSSTSGRQRPRGGDSAAGKTVASQVKAGEDRAKQLYPGRVGTAAPASKS